MIDAMVSPSKQVAANAEAKIATITSELAALQSDAEAAREEMRSLLTERANARSRGDDLAATVAATRADVQKAELAEELSQHTSLEDEARAATVAASELWSAAHQDMQAHDAVWRERGAQIEARLAFLQTSCDEAAQMSQSQQAKLAELRSIHSASHAAHGRDEQARLEADFVALAERREAIQQQLGELDEEETALRDQIPTRLQSWPILARETVGSHLDYQPGAWTRMLHCWRELAELVADHPKSVDAQVWQAFVGSGTVPLWHLASYGRNGRDVELRQYERMLANLRATLERLEQAERSAQTNAMMQG